MGTYDDESPDAGIGERVANSVRKIAQAVMPHKEPVTMGGNNPANKEVMDEANAEAAKAQTPITSIELGHDGESVPGSPASSATGYLQFNKALPRVRSRTTVRQDNASRVPARHRGAQRGQ